VSRFTLEEKADIFILVLRSPDKTSEICRERKVSPITYSMWKRTYIAGDLDTLRHDGRPLEKELRQENEELKVIIGQLYAELNYVKKTRGWESEVSFSVSVLDQHVQGDRQARLGTRIGKTGAGAQFIDILQKVPSAQERRVLRRRAGSGRKRRYEIKDEDAIKVTINELSPMAGLLWIRMVIRPKGIIPGEGTVRRMVRQLGHMVVRGKGRSRKKYEPLVVDGPRQVLVTDTTT